MVSPLPIPSEELVSALQARLLERGIELPTDVIAVVSGSFLDYMHTPSGVQLVAQQIGLDFEEGDQTREYHYLDGFGNVKQEIKPDQLGFAKGIFYRGQPLPERQLKTEQKIVFICEDCGTRSHCPKEIWDPLSGGERTLCNACLKAWPDPRVREEADPVACRTCPAITCQNHPTRGAPSERYQHTG